MPGMCQLLVKPSTDRPFDQENYMAWQDYVCLATQVASLAVQKQVAWQEDTALEGKGAPVSEVVGAAAGSKGGCSHTVYITADVRERLHGSHIHATPGCGAVASAVCCLSAQCAKMQADSAWSQQGAGNAAVHPPLQVGIEGVHVDVLEACNARLAAAVAPHGMVFRGDASHCTPHDGWLYSTAMAQSDSSRYSSDM